MEPLDTQTDISLPTFGQGVKSGLSIAIGYLPIALAFGLLAKNTGLSLIQTVGMSLIVFAGASQFMALGMIGIGTGMVEIIFSTFIVNIRHMLMSMTIHERAVPESKLKRMLYAFGITDEVFAVAATREGPIASPFLYGVGITAYGSWVINSGVGYLVGSILPEAIQGGMNVALYAMFIGLLVPTARTNRLALSLAVLAGGLNFFFSIYLASGWAIIAATVGAVVLIEVLSPLLKEADV